MDGRADHVHDYTLGAATLQRVHAQHMVGFDFAVPPL